MSLLFWKKEKKKPAHTVDQTGTEYEAWLNHLDAGGTTEVFERLKEENQWSFEGDKEIQRYQDFEKKFRPVWNRYFPLMEQIEDKWKNMRQEECFEGEDVDEAIADCKRGIELFEKLQTISKQYDESPLTGTNVYKRLAVLYEKRGEFDLAAEVCEAAIRAGVDEENRLNRMNEKAKNSL